MEEKYHKKPKDKDKEKDKKKPGEAAARAKEIGCTGIHTRDGKFMPCKTHGEYMEAVSKETDKYGKKPKDKKEEDCECDSGNEKCQCEYSDYDELNEKDWVD